MKQLLFLFLIIFVSSKTYSQVVHTPNTCLSKCDAAGDELKNTDLVHLQMLDQQIMKSIMGDSSTFVFPLRIGVVQNNADSISTTELEIRKTIDILNIAFVHADIQFYIGKIEYIQSPLNISLLQENYYEAYNTFSQQHDLQDTISLFLFDYDPMLCDVKDGYISCGRTGGFSYILSERTNNIVLSKFDMEDHKIIVHEFGHFFGLYHTFEEHQFGKELPSGENCAESGDRICDTPADPGTLYEVYVNYSKCEMIGNIDQESGFKYLPLIQNFMSYYKPCYLKKYEFTPNQLEHIKVASRNPLRARFRSKG